MAKKTPTNEGKAVINDKKLSINPSTIKILQNFSKICDYFERDDEQCIKISNVSQDLFAFYIPDENDIFLNSPHFAISDLKNFINIVDKFNEKSNIDFTIREVSFRQGQKDITENIVDRFVINGAGTFAKISAEAPNEVRPFKDGLVMVGEAFEYVNENKIFMFDITQAQIKSLLDSGRAMKVNELRIGFLDNKFSITAIDASDDTTDLFGIDFEEEKITIIGDNKDNSIIIDVASLSYLYSGDYRVHVCEGTVMFQFLIPEKDDIRFCYFVGANDKKYNSKWAGGNNE